jgi:predicted transcriptional regulator
MSKTYDDSERKGLMESPCDEAKRCTDGTLRLIEEAIRRRRERWTDAGIDAGFKTTKELRAFAKADELGAVLRLIRKITKEKLTTRKHGG